MRWQAGKAQPEVGHGLHHRDEVGKIAGLGHIAVRAQFVTAAYIRVGMRSGENHDRNFCQVGVRFDFRQDTTAIFTGKVEIEHDQVGRGFVRVLALPAKETDCLLAIADRVNLEVALAVTQNFAGEIDICRVIVNQQNFSPVFGRIDRGTPSPLALAM